MDVREIALWALTGGVALTVIYAIWAMEGVAVRYVLAMALAAVCALMATLFVSSRVASYVTNHMRFESPDGAADVHMFTYLGVSAAALAGGWILGWVLSAPFARERRSF